MHITSILCCFAIFVDAVALFCIAGIKQQRMPTVVPIQKGVSFRFLGSIFHKISLNAHKNPQKRDHKPMGRVGKRKVVEGSSAHRQLFNFRLELE